MLHDEGGTGTPILLLHGLMGSARTWRDQVGWLRRFGRVYTFDAAGHGRPPPVEPTTEAFVADLAVAAAEITEPVIVLGHSMGGLHGWVFAAKYPERVAALVVEDMAPDFSGRSAEPWAAMIASWPQPFPDDRAVLDYFGPVAGRYFLDAFEYGPDGYRLHGSLQTFRDISEEWIARDFWAEWRTIGVPTLLLEAEHTITPQGQMRAMADIHPAAEHVLIANAGHLIHDDRPDRYRAEVERFLCTILSESGRGGPPS